MRSRRTSCSPVGHPPGGRDVADLTPVAEGAAVLAGDRARKANVALELDLRPLPPTFAAKEEVGQVLLNLLLNAVDATPAGGVVRLEGRAEAGAVVFRVRDSGPGIAPEVARRIFQPFFTTKRGGVGLGLSISQRIARDHGGFLTFSSAPGDGTEFVLRLPLQAGEPALPAPPRDAGVRA